MWPQPRILVSTEWTLGLGAGSAEIWRSQQSSAFEQEAAAKQGNRGGWHLGRHP